MINIPQRSKCQVFARAVCAEREGPYVEGRLRNLGGRQAERGLCQLHLRGHAGEVDRRKAGAGRDSSSNATWSFHCPTGLKCILFLFVILHFFIHCSTGLSFFILFIC